jgi:hypothetical protein
MPYDRHHDIVSDDASPNVVTAAVVTTDKGVVYVVSTN